MKPIVIIGTGLAGYTVAREFRKLAPDVPLLLVSADAADFYSKPMLSNAFAQGKSVASLANASAEQMALQLHAEILAHTQIIAIDSSNKCVRLGDRELPYEKLVLALGADPIRLSLQGDAVDHILSVNDLYDYAKFRSALEGKRHVAILGAGLIGCEFANDLAAGGYKVSVIDIATHPLGRLVPEAVGEKLRGALGNLGIHWHFGVSASTVDKTMDGLRIGFDDGSHVVADVVLSAVGLRPRTQLAMTAGLKVNRGIVTDRQLATSDPNIYALGDCAEIDGLVLPYVMPLMHGARALAKTLAGAATPISYPAMPVVVKTPACPLVISPPAVNSVGAWDIQVEGEGIRALFKADDGALLGFALAGTASAEKQRLTKQLPPVLP
ncbi:MAG TPA: FAD-dependent oxidoreductase [Gammaproteobacteria bacterium]|nr:FAD-dependent oxidoreductase [Gammaproteobacteria bacterium]